MLSIQKAKNKIVNKKEMFQKHIDSTMSLSGGAAVNIQPTLKPNTLSSTSEPSTTVAEARHANEAGLLPGPASSQVQAFHRQALETTRELRSLGLPEVACREYEDEGAGRAIDALSQANPTGKLTAQQIYHLLHKATRDLDNNAAGGEFNDLQKFIESNWDRLEPEAREVWLTYYETVMESRADGKSGIAQDEYENMLKEMKKERGCPETDESTTAAIEALDKKNPKGTISADQMYDLIKDATSDADNQAAGTEFDQLALFVQKNFDRLSPDAKKVWAEYARVAGEAAERGQTGISREAYDKMLEKMDELRKGCDPDDEVKYQDESAGAAIERLKQENPEGEITGEQMRRLVLDATRDLDAQAAGKEFEDLVKFVAANYERLSEEAREIWDIYMVTAGESIKEGESGIDQEDYDEMAAEMDSVLQEPCGTREGD